MVLFNDDSSREGLSNPSYFEIYRPINFELDGISGVCKRQHERICCLSDTIIRKMSRDKRYRVKGRMPLHSRHLKDLLGRNYKSVIDASIESGVINREGGYVMGKKSYEYSLAEEYSAGFVKHSVTDTYVQKSLKKNGTRGTAKTSKDSSTRSIGRRSTERFPAIFLRSHFPLAGSQAEKTKSRQHSGSFKLRKFDSESGGPRLTNRGGFTRISPIFHVRCGACFALARIDLLPSTLVLRNQHSC